MKKCKIKNCERIHLANGLCNMHYLRVYRNKSLGDHNQLKGISTINRLMKQFSVNDKGCWLYTGKLTEKGYAHVRDKEKMRFAHVIMYEYKNGKIPMGLELDHLCRVRHCFNQNHLEAVTHKENIQRGNSGCTWDKRKRTKLGRFI